MNELGKGARAVWDFFTKGTLPEEPAEGMCRECRGTRIVTVSGLELPCKLCLARESEKEPKGLPR